MIFNEKDVHGSVELQRKPPFPGRGCTPSETDQAMVLDAFRVRSRRLTEGSMSASEISAIV
jgi:hypothetical protein